MKRRSQTSLTRGAELAPLRSSSIAKGELACGLSALTIERATIVCLAQQPKV